MGKNETQKLMQKLDFEIKIIDDIWIALDQNFVEFTIIQSFSKFNIKSLYKNG